MNNEYKQHIFSLIRLLFVSITLTAPLTSCEDFVAIDPPKNELVTKTVFTSDATANSAMRGVYINMNLSSSPFSGYTGSVSNLSGLASDELFARNAGDYFDIAGNMILPENGVILSRWSNLYHIIYSCNSVIDGLANSQGVSESTRKQLAAEAKFVRAFCYFYLVNWWGEVPLVVTIDYRVNRALPRASTAEVYAQIIDDLITARTNLPSDFGAGAGERVRATKWAASALLARVYLYLENWEQAELEAASIIESTETFSLVDLDAVFLKNSSEAIFQLLPTSTFEDSFAGQLYLPGTSATSVTSYPMSSHLYTAFEANDARYDEWVRNKTVNGVTYYYPYKYRVRIPGAGNPHMEYTTLLRLSELYLIRAEARAWQNRITGANSAEADINAIRNRAGLANTAASTKEEILSAIAQERRVELFTEGHRWFDLIRTGQADAVLAPIKADWTSEDGLWPVPNAEMNKNPVLTQNPGY